MDVEIFVHGVPYGQSFWGKDEREKDFFGSFYVQNCPEKTRFLIQTRSVGGKTYCYYHYLVYGNVLSSEGRKGSYFGLSVRLDMYARDFKSMYDVLAAVFDTEVKHKVLETLGENLKYKIADFTSSNEVMKAIYGRTWSMLEGFLSNGEIVPLNGFNAGGDKLLIVNLQEAVDVGMDNVEAEVKQKGKLVLSPNHPTQREKNQQKNFDAQIAQERQSHEEQLSAQVQREKNQKKAYDERLTAQEAEFQEKIKLRENEYSKTMEEKEKQISELLGERDKLKAQNAEQQRRIKEVEDCLTSVLAQIQKVLGRGGVQSLQSQPVTVRAQTVQVHQHSTQPKESKAQQNCRDAEKKPEGKSSFWKKIIIFLWRIFGKKK